MNTYSSPTGSPDYLSLPRQRLIKFAKFFTVLSACGGLLLVGVLLIAGLNTLITSLNNIRTAMGLTIEPGKPDYLVLVIAAFLLLLIVGAILVFYLKYQRMWQNKVHEFWKNDPKAEKRYSKLKKLSETATPNEREAHVAYIRGLVQTNEWRTWYASNNGRLGFPAYNDPKIIKEEDASTLAAEMFKELNKDIAARAFAVGLVVGISHSRLMDRLAIVFAAHEIQYHVMSRLGKRPTLRTWPLLMTHTLSSLFFNLYLSREEVSAISLSLKGIAFGVQAGAEALDNLVEDLDLEGGGDIIGTALLALKAGVGISKAGAISIVMLIDKAGDDILEGLLAGGILYYQGASLAAECLAVDKKSLTSADFALSPKACVNEGIKRAGTILKDIIDGRRKQLADRRKKAWSMLKDKLPGWLQKKVKSAETEEPSISVSSK